MARSKEIFKELFQPRHLKIVRELGIWRPVEPTAGGALEFKESLEKLGTTFVKLGQLLSTRPDLIPPLYAKELAHLQDKVSPLTIEEVHMQVIDAFDYPIDELFSFFDPTPLASGSIAQTHRVTLLDGTQGVIKVRRPGLVEKVSQDLDLLRSLAKRLEPRVEAAKLIQLQSLVDELSRSLMGEMDLVREVENMKLLKKNLASYKNIYIPDAIHEFYTPSVFIMEEVIGIKLTDAKAPTNGPELAADLMRSYIKQITVDGIYHADPHAGNVFLTSDNKVALLDFGLIGRLDTNTRFEVSLLLLALSENKAEDLSEMLLRMSTVYRDSDEQQFSREIRRLLPHYHQGRLQQISIGTALIDIQRLAIECKIGLPISFALIGKTLSQADSIARHLAPEADLLKVLRESMSRFALLQIQDQLNPTSMIDNFALPLYSLWHIPQRLEHLLNKAEKGEVKIGIVPTELTEATKEIRTVTNRIAWALFCSSMVIASALLMNVQGVGTILGYPALGFLGFVIAFILGVFLLWRMWRTPGGL